MTDRREFLAAALTTTAAAGALNFFVKLPNPDKQFTVMPGAHTSMRSRNWERAYHVLDTFFARPALAYTGNG